jgi:hypothetical protein
MLLRSRRRRFFALVILLVGILSWMPAEVAHAQQAPVAAMFSDDQKRDASLASSFLVVDLPATTVAAFPARVYLSAGDVERAFDKAEFRPEAAIVPTNTDLLTTAQAPSTQRVLIDRVRKRPDVMRDLDDQIATVRKQPASTGGEQGLLRIGVDTFMAHLPRRASDNQKSGAFPKAACFVATDFASGGAVDRRELFVQDRFRKGIAGCLAALDAAGAQSLVLPLMGAASSREQANDALYEGQRVLKECRLINATAGIALGIHDFAGTRRSLREIGLVQWDREIVGMFKVPKGSRAAKSAQSAYREYAEQIQQAFRKGLAGEKTTASDVNGSCRAIFNGQ